MTSIDNLLKDTDFVKKELKKLRQDFFKEKAKWKTESEKIISLIPKTEDTVDRKSKKKLDDEKPSHPITIIGYISSCFKFKNGVPRQSSLCPTAKGTLKIEKSIFTNPEHSLIGLEEFSHVWILFIFHENDNIGWKAKVHPPRLNGASVGVFSTRSPHRPSAVGLSLTKLEKLEGDTLYLSGIDLLDGTPVIDIKPYIPAYDATLVSEEFCLGKQERDLSKNSDLLRHNLTNTELDLTATSVELENNFSLDECKTPKFLSEPFHKLDVVFTNRALTDLENIFSNQEQNPNSVNNSSLYNGHLDIKQAIIEVLQNDPRSVYRKEKCSDKLYYFYINNVHITCWFDDNTAEVLKIKLCDLTSK